MKEFFYRYLKWVGEKNSYREVILSTRFRLARNIVDFPFPPQASTTQRKRLLNKVEWALKNERNLSQFELWNIEKLPEIVQEALIEKHLVSDGQLNDLSGAGLIVDKSGKLSVMVNEEDHFRFQVLSGGFDIKENWEAILSLEDLFSEYFNFAFDDKLGYLTSCITNLGCGLRISFLVHLPGLIYSGKIKDFLRKIRASKILVRGLYGEGTKGIAGFYQITTRSSLGYNENQLIKKMGDIAQKIVQEEISAREILLAENKRLVEDIVGRAFGILEHAWYINSFETINLLSDIRLGVSIGIIDMPLRVLDLLLILTLPAHLQLREAKDLAPEERDGVRADLLRDVFKSYKIH